MAGIFSANKKGSTPRRGGSKAKGKFVLQAVPGDGKILLPKGEVSPRSAMRHADDAASAFGLGKAKSGRWTK